MTLNVVPLVAAPQIVFRNVDALQAYARNARTHSPDQIALLSRLIDEFGWTNAVLADDDGIVAGHGRVTAARALYKAGKRLRFPNGAQIPDGTVPVVDCSGWSQEQRRAYIISDNQSSLRAGWDEELLKLELTDLQMSGFDLELTGFTDEELADLLDVGEPPDADKDPDDAPDAPDVPHSQPGDVWVLGAHRVMCGSSLDGDAWDRLMRGERADVVWTDPPYNVNIGRKNRELDKRDKGNRGKTGSIENDNMSDAKFQEFLLSAFGELFKVMKPGAPFYIAHPQGEASRYFLNAITDTGFKIQIQVIWKKNIHVLGRMDFQAIHEPIIYGWKPGSAHRWYGGRKTMSVIEHGEGGPVSRLPDGRWAIKIGDDVLIVDGEAKLEQHPGSVIFEPKPAKSDLHPTMKPVALVERMLKFSGRAGDIAADAFGGSGTTLIAADRLGMSARLMEIDPAFCDVIVKRWQDYTGRRAVHAETGEEFPA